MQIALFSMGATRTGGGNFIMTLLIILPMAIASWHFLERFALQMATNHSRSRASSAKLASQCSPM